MADRRTAGVRVAVRLAITSLLFIPACSGSESAGDRGSDLAQLEKEVEVYPTAAGFVELSLAYSTQGAHQKAIAAARQAIQLAPRDPNSARAYNNICVSLAQLGEWEAAVDACESALAIQPDLQLARNNLAWVRAEKDARESTAEPPDDRSGDSAQE